MSQEHLALYDTPVDRQEFRLAFVIIGILLAATAAILPIRDVRWPPVDSFIPIVNAIMLIGSIIAATILYAQARVARSSALIVLGSGFVLSTLLMVSYTLTFPGAFAPEGLLHAGLNGTAWIATFRRAAVAVSVILYVQLKERELARPPFERPAVRISIGVISATIVAVALTLLATDGQGLLPAQFINHFDEIYAVVVAKEWVLIVLFGVTAIALLRTGKSVLDFWLFVAASDWLIQGLLIMVLHSRFTVGWYYLFVMTLFAHLVVVLALIAETIRLYGKLALSTAAREREREARLMSMDAVTAAISHEIGQPLTAVRLNASAGLEWLTQPRPDISKAITSLRSIREDSQRTFDVIKSVRAMFKGVGPVSVFNLNDLVRETASVMNTELADAKISLELTLDETLPPIAADRVQIQRVLINLITNAIQSLRASPRRTRLLSKGRPRRITVHSASGDGPCVRLSVSDTGSGIAADELERIFDPFYTTKASGMGLGLPLCRTIAVDHNGALWASPGEECGATFHLELPCN